MTDGALPCGPDFPACPELFDLLDEETRAGGHRPLHEVRAEYLRVVSPEEAEGDDANSVEID
jgi:hypothetical protein